MASAPNSEAEFGASVKVIPPYGSNAGSAQQTGRCRHRPLRGEEQAASTTPASGAQRSVCAAVAREWAGNAAEITPKVSSNAGQSLSHGLWPCQLPLHKGAFGDGGCGLPRRPVGPPRNDNRFLSFRGAERRGNPSFLRWTGVRAAEVVGPYGRSTEVPAMGRCRHRPLRKAQSTTQASRRVAERPRPRPRGMGGNRRKNHPRRGTAPPRPPGQRLAKRKARKEQLVKFRFCPTTELCSTAY